MLKRKSTEYEERYVYYPDGSYRSAYVRYQKLPYFSVSKWYHAEKLPTNYRTNWLTKLECRNLGIDLTHDAPIVGFKRLYNEKGYLPLYEVEGDFKLPKDISRQ